MKSWGAKTLLFLCMILIRLHSIIAGCEDYFKPAEWGGINITLKNLTETIPLVDAETFKDVMYCTLQNEIKKGRDAKHILKDCNDIKMSPNCQNETDNRVSFYEFMCLTAKAFDIQSEACTNDTVMNWLKSKLHQTTTTLPAPSTTTTTTTTTWSSPLATSTTQPSVNTSLITQSTIGPAPVISTTSMTSLPANHQKYGIYNEKKDRGMYTGLGISLILNVALLLWVVVLYMRPRGSSTHSPQMNRGPVDIPLNEERQLLDGKQESLSEIPKPTLNSASTKDIHVNCEDEYQQ